MNILIKKAKIIDRNSPFNKKVLDLLIKNGEIDTISENIEDSNAQLIEGENLHVSMGWVDLKTETGDPGNEHKETIESTLELSAKGGFTQICTLPNNFPVTDSKAQIQYQLNKASKSIVNINPIGAITKGLKGEELSEMFDMHACGCKAFSDDNNYLNTGIMHRALLYAKQFDCKLIFNLNEPYLSSGLVNEGMASIQTGLKANASVGEIIQLEKIIRIVEYIQGSVHVTGISSSESIDLIENAKKRGVNISCDVNMMNLVFCEKEVIDFNSNMKVFPVLRSEQDMNSLIKAVENGIIDNVVSDHRPMDSEEKEIEFDNASFGCYQLQSMFSALMTYSDLPMELIIDILANKNRSFIMQSKTSIDKGEKAELTLFNPNEKVTYNEDSMPGIRKLNPFFKKTLKGKVIGIVNNNKVHLN